MAATLAVRALAKSIAAGSRWCSVKSGRPSANAGRSNPQAVAVGGAESRQPQNDTRGSGVVLEDRQNYAPNRAVYIDKNFIASTRDRDSCTLFVKNLPFSTSQDTLAEFFPEAVNYRLPKNEEGRPRGIAYIQFENEDKVEEAIREKQGTEINGRVVTLDYVGPKSSFKGRSDGGEPMTQNTQSKSGEAGKAKTLIVMGLNFQTDNDQLHGAFPDAASARIVMDYDTNRSRGFGFVDFDSPEKAMAAQKSMNGTELDGRTLRVDFAMERSAPRGGGGGGAPRGGRGGFRGGFNSRGGGRGGGFNRNS